MGGKALPLLFAPRIKSVDSDGNPMSAMRCVESTSVY